MVHIPTGHPWGSLLLPRDRSPTFPSHGGPGPLWACLPSQQIPLIFGIVIIDITFSTMRKTNIRLDICP